MDTYFTVIHGIGIFVSSDASGKNNTPRLPTLRLDSTKSHYRRSVSATVTSIDVTIDSIPSFGIMLEYKRTSYIFTMHDH